MVKLAGTSVWYIKINIYIPKSISSFLLPSSLYSSFPADESVPKMQRGREEGGVVFLVKPVSMA